MAILLDSVTLPESMIWEDRDSWNPVVQEVKVTLGGTPIVYSTGLQGGRPITLMAYQDQGWLTKEQVDAVKALASVPGGQYTLTLGSESFSVVFRHHESPAFEVQPLIPRAIPLSGDYYAGAIRLMTV